VLFYRAALPLSSRTLNYAAGIIRRHLKAIGSRWRKPDPGKQALLVLAYLRKGETFAQLAAGFGIGRTTAWRYVDETVDLLAARAPKLRAAVRNAKKAGHAYVILDGTLIPIDRVARDKPFYSGKHKKHGMNLQVIASPRGDVLWVPARCPARSTIKRPSGSGASSTSWRKPAWSPSRTRATRAAPGRRSRTRARTSPSPRKRPTVPTRNSAPRRARERAAQGLEDPHQAPLLPVAHRETRQSHSRTAAPRGITRLESAQWCSAMMLSREIIGWALDSGNAVQPLSRPVLQLPRARVPGPHGVRARKTHSPPLRRAIPVLRHEHPPRRLAGVQVPGLAVPLRDRLQRRQQARPPGAVTVAGPGSGRPSCTGGGSAP
jgi:hypothetical protein